MESSNDYVEVRVRLKGWWRVMLQLRLLSRELARCFQRSLGGTAR